MAVQGHQAVHVARHGAVGRVHVGVDRAGLHVVHRDATRAQVARQALGQAHDGGLAHAVHAESGPWHAVGVGAADGDHAAIGTALSHVAHGGLGGYEHGAHVDVERVVKVGQRKAADFTRDGDARVVDEDVQAAQLARGAVHRLREGNGIGAVGLQGQGLAAARSNVRHQRLRRRCGAAVGEGHGRPVARQAPHDGRANAARAAGDERDLARQRATRR